MGRKPASRPALAKAFIAKMIWNLPTTEALIDLLKSSPTLRCSVRCPQRRLIPRLRRDRGRECACEDTWTEK